MSPEDRADLQHQLAMITGDEPEPAYLQIKYKPPRANAGHTRLFVSAHDVSGAADTIAALEGFSVYLGVVPHAQPDPLAVTRAWVLWADIDGRESRARLKSFEPASSLVVQSSDEDHAHAYWALSSSVEIDAARHTNRRLAIALEADQAVADVTPSLRPIGSLNYKHSPPMPVICVHRETVTRELEEIATGLPHPRVCRFGRWSE